jgi:hypothetical protein
MAGKGYGPAEYGLSKALRPTCSINAMDASGSFLEKAGWSQASAGYSFFPGIVPYIIFQ